MTIDVLLQNRISPFDTEDIGLTKLFNYFLYDAPTLETAGFNTGADNVAGDDVSKEMVLQQRWDSFIAELGGNPHKIYAAGYQKLPDVCDEYGLGNSSVFGRRFKGYVCKRADMKPRETDCACVHRHLRNAIAHKNVFMVNAGNRKYILFEDYNKAKKLTARLLFTQSDLKKLKRIMGR